MVAECNSTHTPFSLLIDPHRTALHRRPPWRKRDESDTHDWGSLGVELLHTSCSPTLNFGSIPLGRLAS
jgi:hypothetical protein